jgi:hypothetical protein
VLTQRWQRGNVGNTIPVLLPLKEKFATILGRKNSLPREQKSLPKPQKTLHLRPKTLPKNPLILDGAENFLERRKEILRTEWRISPHGAKNGSARIFPLEKVQINFVFCSLIRNFAGEI